MSLRPFDILRTGLAQTDNDRNDWMSLRPFDILRTNLAQTDS